MFYEVVQRLRKTSIDDLTISEHLTNYLFGLKRQNRIDLEYEKENSSDGKRCLRRVNRPMDCASAVLSYGISASWSCDRIAMYIYNPGSE